MVQLAVCNGLPEFQCTHMMMIITSHLVFVFILMHARLRPSTLDCWVLPSLTLTKNLFRLHAQRLDDFLVIT